MKLKLLFVLLFVCFMIPSSLAFGISPGDLYFGQVNPGGYSEINLLISGIYDAPWQVIIKPDNDWFTFNDTIIINKSNPARTNIGLTIPDDIASGNYKGEIDFYFEPLINLSSGTKIKLINVISVPYYFNVTREEKISCIMGGVSLTPSETNGVIEFIASIKNTGTVRINPNFNLLFYNSENQFLESWTDDEILPTTTKSISYSFTHNLKPGNYNLLINSTCGLTNLSYEVYDINILNYKGSFQKIDVLDSQEGLPLEAVFVNEGSSAVYAKLSGTIFYKNEIVAVFNGDPLLVMPKDKVILDAFVDLPRTKDYVIKSKVIYEDLSTPEKEIIVYPKKVSSKNYSILILIVFFIIIIFLLFIIKKKKKF